MGESKLGKSVLSCSSLVVIGVILLLVNGIGREVLGSMSLDLTEEGLYSLSDGSRNVLGDIKDPITLKLYYSKTDGSKFPAVKLFGTRIHDLLKEYERYGKGKLNIEVYDPRPDSEEEEWAESYGLTPISSQSHEKIFLGLVGVNGLGAEKAIPVFNFAQQELLEYDITELVYSLIVTKKPVVGVLSTQPIKGEPASAMAQVQGMSPSAEPWIFTKLISSVAEIRYLDPSSTSSIDKDVDLLMAVHPRDFSESLLYAVDQFVLRGGKLFAFVDPYFESDQSALPPAGGNPLQAYTADKSSNLNKLTAAWGIALKEKKAVADLNLATKLRAGQQGVKDFVMVLSLDQARGNMNQEDVTTHSLNQMILPWSGALELSEIDGVLTEPLLETTDRARLVEESTYKFGGGQPDALLRESGSGKEKYILAARSRGKFKTNFPDGAPEGGKSDGETHLTESIDKSAIVLVADVDFLTDRYSVIPQNIFGTIVYRYLNNNLVFVQNSVEHLAGSDDLISIRSRGKFVRPFLLVQDIERDASVRWQQEEMRLQAKLNGANQRLRQLQSASGAGGEQGQQVLSDAIFEEMKKFRDERADAQKHLRNVRREMRQDKESLGTRLFLLNTFAVPILLILNSLFYFILKRKKRNQV